MAPRYLDWNGNGSIDPVDIGVSHALDDDCENAESQRPDSSPNPHAQASGCLSSALILLSAAVAFTLLVFAVL